MDANCEAKIQRVLELFSGGEYQVDAKAVADAIIRRSSRAWALDSEVEPRLEHAGAGTKLRGVVLVGRLEPNPRH